MPATLRDVAERAQVSMRTVSNVVSGYTHVSERMRAKVLAVIEELDYRPNPVARTLRTGRTGMLALVVPEIDVPYFSELARDVIEAAAEVGYRVMIDQTGHDHDRERQLLTGEDRTMLFDGLLFSPLVTKSELLDMHPTTRMPPDPPRRARLRRPVRPRRHRQRGRREGCREPSHPDRAHPDCRDRISTPRRVRDAAPAVGGLRSRPHRRGPRAAPGVCDHGRALQPTRRLSGSARTPRAGRAPRRDLLLLRPPGDRSHACRVRHRPACSRGCRGDRHRRCGGGALRPTIAEHGVAGHPLHRTNPSAGSSRGSRIRPSKQPRSSPRHTRRTGEHRDFLTTPLRADRALATSANCWQSHLQRAQSRVRIQRQEIDR